MATQAPYDDYKDSGLDWIGDIPSHWQQKRYKFLFQASNEKNGNNIVGEMLSVSGYRGIEIKEYEDESHKRTEEELTEYRVVRPGQLVVNTMWLNYAGLGVSEHEGHVSPAYRSYWVDSNLHGGFVHHLLRSSNYVAGYTKYMQGIRPNSLQIKTDDFLSFPVIIPPSDEQTQIAAFLGHETTKIDQLIAKQVRLIELLKEKRQAVISHAVTKGLNPDAPMKDSGVEWLGEVPAHWSMVKFSVAASIRNGQVDPRIEPYTNYTLIAPNHIEGGTGTLLYAETSSEQGADSGKYLCKAGEVIYSKIRPALAKACLSPSNTVLCSADMYPIQARAELTNEFLLRFMLTKEFTAFATLASDRVAMPKINREALAECRVPVPPVDEQKRIGKFVETSIHKIDTLVEKAGEAIALMKEHRTALISAAVAGKIDVRGWQKPDTKPEETATAVSA